MAKGHLNNRLQCKDCGTVRMSLAPPPADHDIVACATCGSPLGRWLDLKHDLALQMGEGVFAIEDGQFIRP